MMGYGYENAAGDRISALIDMINGGGPGRSGGTFEGGGILSLLANAVAKPYGSVRERPGHTPMGAAAAPMDVLRPVDTGADVAPVETMALPESQSFERSFETEGAAPRYLTEDEAARLAELDESIAPPDLLSLFSGIPAGAPLSSRESMILDALLSSASFNPEVQARRGPSFKRYGDITIPPYTLALQGPPVAEPRPAADTAAETAASSSSLRPEPRPAAPPAAETAGTDAPIRVVLDGVPYDVFPDNRAVYAEDEWLRGGRVVWFAPAGTEVSSDTSTHARIMALVGQRR